MSIFFQKEGILTTVQDLGRFGFRQLGINPSGVMDKTAARLINILLSNNENEAVLEMHFPAPEFLFEENALFALGGADFKAQLNDKQIEIWKIYFAEKNSKLKFTGKSLGNRAYFSIKGGFEVENWLGSASTNLTAKVGGFSGRKMQKNDRLFFNRPIELNERRSFYKISNSIIPFYNRFPTIRIIAGAEFELLTGLSEQNFFSQDFVVSQNSNRMGFRLNGEPLYLLDEKELVSSAVDFGTIQLLPDGQMIILMADHQTSGGYPRIGHIIEADLSLVAQLGAGNKIAFQLISLEEAEKNLIEAEKNLNLLRIGCKLAESF